jgi:hypothetical protein
MLLQNKAANDPCLQTKKNYGIHRTPLTKELNCTGPIRS